MKLRIDKTTGKTLYECLVCKKEIDINDAVIHLNNHLADENLISKTNTLKDEIIVDMEACARFIKACKKRKELEEVIEEKARELREKEKEGLARREKDCPLSYSKSEGALLCTDKCKWYNDETGNCMFIEAILAIKNRLEKIQKTPERTVGDMKGKVTRWIKGYIEQKLSLLLCSGKVAFVKVRMGTKPEGGFFVVNKSDGEYKVWLQGAEFNEERGVYVPIGERISEPIFVGKLREVIDFVIRNLDIRAYKRMEASYGLEG